jgi:hypothetical protein
MTIDLDDARTSNSKPLAKVKDAGRHVLEVLDARRGEAGEQIGRLKEKAGVAASHARDKAGVVGRRGYDTVKQNPIPTGLAVLGAGVGLFLLLNPKTRGAAANAALRLWNEVKARR